VELFDKLNYSKLSQSPMNSHDKNSFVLKLKLTIMYLLLYNIYFDFLNVSDKNSDQFKKVRDNKSHPFQKILLVPKGIYLLMPEKIMLFDILLFSENETK
jgi:hypothetical protein